MLRGAKGQPRTKLAFGLITINYTIYRSLKPRCLSSLAATLRLEAATVISPDRPLQLGMKTSIVTWSSTSFKHVHGWVAPVAPPLQTARHSGMLGHRLLDYNLHVCHSSDNSETHANADVAHNCNMRSRRVRVYGMCILHRDGQLFRLRGPLSGEVDVDFDIHQLRAGCYKYGRMWCQVSPQRLPLWR